jgi:glycosyltransferase involved in cell wall biosynthesis
MKASIYNPYLDTLGGGERYTMAVAMVLRDHGYQVKIEWSNSQIIEQLENRFGFNLKNIEVVPSINKGDGSDLCFWVSDGSVPLLKARKNLLHFQVPFTHVNGKSLLNKMKLFRVKKIICNSDFTKKIIDKEYGVESVVLYPPVDTSKFKPKHKENVILFIGRFSKLLQAKNQDVLISIFKKLVDRGLTDWKLILAGGVEVGAEGQIQQLKLQAVNYPIEIIKSPSFFDLTELYGKARIFWSAVGYGADEQTEPQKVEHFGISVVEAMSAGCVPVVYNAGGYKEIINSGKNGLLWDNDQQLIDKTSEIIKYDENIRHLRNSLRETADRFSYDVFSTGLMSLIGDHE